MSQILVDQIRKQRQFKKVIGKFTFICRRPTDVDAVELHRGGGGYAEICERFVVGWDGVTEDDIVGGGGGDAIPFHAALWKEWVADRPDFWEPIANAVLDAYKAHTGEMEEARKNSSPGSGTPN